MPRGLIPEAFVQQSELVVWSEGMTSIHKNDGCAICHEAFSSAVPDICRVLDCSHVFHAKCVDLWFIKATFCPLCKSDLKLTYRNTSSQRSLGRSSHTSSQMSLGQGSHSSSLRSGQILVGHSNSDPALLRILQEHPHTLGPQHPASGRSPPATPELVRQGGSTPSLNLSYSDRSLPVMGSSRSERSVGILSSSSSGALPAVQELSDEARFADDSQRSHSSNPPSPQTMSPGMQTTNRGQAETIEEYLPTLLPASQQAPNGASAGPAQPPQAAHFLSEDGDLTGSGAATATRVPKSPLPTSRTGELDEEQQTATAPGAGGTDWKTIEHLSTVLTVPHGSSWINSRSNVGKLAAAKSKEHAAMLTAIPQGAGGSATSSTDDGDCEGPATVITMEAVGEGTLRPAVPAAPQPRSREIFGEEATVANAAEHNRKGVSYFSSQSGQVLLDVDVVPTVDVVTEEDLRRNRSSSAPPDKSGDVCPVCNAGDGDRTSVPKSTVFPSATPGSMTPGSGPPVHAAPAQISLPPSPSMSTTATPTATKRGKSPSWIAGQRPGYMATSSVSPATATTAATAHVASVPTQAAAATGSGTSRPGATKAVFNAWSFTNPGAASTAPSPEAAAAGGAGQPPRVSRVSLQC